MYFTWENNLHMKYININLFNTFFSASINFSKCLHIGPDSVKCSAPSASLKEFLQNAQFYNEAVNETSSPILSFCNTDCIFCDRHNFFYDLADLIH